MEIKRLKSTCNDEITGIIGALKKIKSITESSSKKKKDFDYTVKFDIGRAKAITTTTCFALPALDHLGSFPMQGIQLLK